MISMFGLPNSTYQYNDKLTKSCLRDVEKLRVKSEIQRREGDENLRLTKLTYECVNG